MKDNGLEINDKVMIPAFTEIDLVLDAKGEYVEITEKDFKNQSIINDRQTITLNFPIIDTVEQSYIIAKQNLESRVLERAKYFQLIDIVLRKRDNDPKRQPLSYFIEQENRILTESMQEIINSEFTLAKEKPFRVNVNMRLPGFEVSSSVFNYDVELYSEK